MLLRRTSSTIVLVLCASALSLSGGHAARANNKVTSLTTGGGPTLIATKAYTVFVQPPGYSFDPSYIADINAFFVNLYGPGSNTGTSSQLYRTLFEYVGNQYTDSGFLTATDSVVVGSPFGNACTDRSYFDTRFCMNSGGLQDAIETARQQQGWPTTWSSFSLPTGFSPPVIGYEAMYFVFLPPGVGYCWNNPFTGNDCAYRNSCGFHNFYTSQGKPVVFAVIPYAANTIECGNGERPNGEAADESISAITHEHFEMMTDPFFNAWWDRVKGKEYGEEMADKCQGIFGPVLGGSRGAEYDQVFNGVGYWIQDEWSNAAGGCVSGT